MITLLENNKNPNNAEMVLMYELRTKAKEKLNKTTNSMLKMLDNQLRIRDGGEADV